MNSFKNENISSLLDYDYSQKEHLENLTLYKNINKRLTNKFDYEEIDVETYFKNLKTLYLLTERYIECGIEDITPTIREIIFESYSFLLQLYQDKSLNDITTELFDIYDRKNWDYQNASENQLRWEGAISFKVTLEHKIARFKSFFDGNEFKVKDEKVSDTIGDLINYCIIYLIWSNKNFPKERKIKINVKER